MRQVLTNREIHHTAPVAGSEPTTPATMPRSLMLLRGDFRAHGLNVVAFLRAIHPPMRTPEPSDAFGECHLEFRAGPPHRRTAVVAVVRELARRAARTWYASLEQPPSVEDPA